MEVVEGLFHMLGYGVVIAIVAVATPRLGNLVASLVGRMAGRKGRMTPAE